MTEFPLRKEHSCLVVSFQNKTAVLRIKKAVSLRRDLSVLIERLAFGITQAEGRGTSLTGCSPTAKQFHWIGSSIKKSVLIARFVKKRFK